MAGFFRIFCLTLLPCMLSFPGYFLFALEKTDGDALLEVLEPASSLSIKNPVEESSFKLSAEASAFDLAEELFNATLFERAIDFYNKVENVALLPLIKSRIGASLYYQGLYQEAIESLDKSGQIGKLPFAEDQKRILLLVLSYRQLGNYQAVIDTLSLHPLKLYPDEEAFELGFSHFFLKNYKLASLQFEKIRSLKKSDLGFLSEMYLLKIALISKDFLEAGQIIDRVKAPNESFEEELAFLKGDFEFACCNYEGAINQFQLLLNKKSAGRTPWFSEALYKLSKSHFMAAQLAQKRPSYQAENLAMAQQILVQLIVADPQEKYVLDLGRVNLSQAALLNNDFAYSLAIQTVTAFPEYLTAEAKKEALLILAEAAVSHAERRFFYDHLASAFLPGAALYGQYLYQKGMNDYTEAEKTRSRVLFSAAALCFQAAGESFLAIPMDEESSKKGASCLKYQAKALWGENTFDGRLQAIIVLQDAVESSIHEKQGENEMGELEALYGTYILSILNDSVSEKVIKRAEKFLLARAALKSLPAMFTLADFYAKQGLHEQAQKVYFELAAMDEKRTYTPEALMQASFSMELVGGLNPKVRALRKKIYEEFSESNVAPLAYFFSYSYQEYLQGDRAAIKHLDRFKELFPDSYLLMNVNYLIGLDLKRDRFSDEKRWIRKKNPALSLEAFNEVQKTFVRFVQAKQIPEDQLSYYANLYYRAKLEKALVYYAVAEESSAAKKEIYLQYGIEALEKLVSELEDEKEENSSIQLLNQTEAFPEVLEESLYWLGVMHLKEGKDDLGSIVFNKMSEKYLGLNITSGYYLSRIRFEMGLLEAKKMNYETALNLLILAEEAGRKKFLSVDEALLLWIEQSKVYRFLGRLEEAMLVLSKAVNETAVSYLRVEAMVMRASLYEELGRPELARRQLEFVAKMGGKWADFAKLKLGQ